MTAEAFVLLMLLGIKHFIADFALQTNNMVHDKGIYGARGGLVHAVHHGLGTMIVLVLLFWSIPFAFVIGLFDSIVHYHIDWTKQQLNHGLTVQDRMFWFYLGLDQALHYLTYIVIVAFITI